RSVRAIASCAVTSRPPFLPLNPSALTTASRPANASWTGTPALTSFRNLYRTFVWLTLGESLMICLNASSIVMCLFLFGYWKTPAHRVRVNRGYVVVQLGCCEKIANLTDHPRIGFRVIRTSNHLQKKAGCLAATLRLQFNPSALRDYGANVALNLDLCHVAKGPVIDGLIQSPPDFADLATLNQFA